MSSKLLISLYLNTISFIFSLVKSSAALSTTWDTPKPVILNPTLKINIAITIDAIGSKKLQPRRTPITPIPAPKLAIVSDLWSHAWASKELDLAILASLLVFLK